MFKMKSQRGFTMVEALVALGISGVVLISLMQVMGNSAKYLASQRDRQAKNDARRFLEENMSCQFTKQRNPSRFSVLEDCTSGAINMYDNNDRPIGNADSRFGPWVVRARCDGGRFVVKIAQIKGKNLSYLNSTDPNQFRNDDLNGKPLTFEHPQADLFETSFCTNKSYQSYGGHWSCDANWANPSLPCGPCIRPNPVTGGCSCPAGFTSDKIKGCQQFGAPDCTFLCKRN